MRRIAIILGLVLFPLSNALAEEGMFLLDRLPAKALKQAGLKISIEQLSKLSRAVVQVARGGSGSFVSANGLLVTNHHVAYGCLARLDALKAHKGILKKGYLAKSTSAEVNCPGYDLLVIDKIEDVTRKVLDGVPYGNRKNFRKRFEQIRKKKEALRIACEKASGGKRVCQVSEMDAGRYYYMTTYLRVRDVRLVYAPPKDLGKFGGDVDNWMFPRHTADFTFLRAYVNKAGEGVGYAKSNQPLKTPTFLKVSKQGYGKTSLALVVGFPGRTSRHVTSHAVRYQVSTVVPQALELIKGVLAVVSQRRKANDDAKRKYAGLDASLNNALKYYTMSREGYAKWKLLANKLAKEKKLKNTERYNKGNGHALFPQIGKVYKKLKAFAATYSAARRLTSWAVPTVRVAYDIVKWGREKAIPDADRKLGRYKDKNVYRFKEGAARLERETELGTERALLAFFLRYTEKLPRRQRLRSVKKLLRWHKKAERKLARKPGGLKKQLSEAYGLTWNKDALIRAIDLMYAQTKVLARSTSKKDIDAAVAFRKKAFEMNEKQLAALGDPLLRFATDLEQELRKLREGPYALVEQYLGSVLRPRWVRAIGATYPDANFTPRLSFGKVLDYTSTKTGKTHRYVTDLKGLLAKHKGKYPFNVPAKLRQGAKLVRSSTFRDATINGMAVNFVATLDTTGGNSGSATLDNHGRLIGLLFDGTPESILSDWQYLDKEQRSIVVDIRFALFMAQLDGAVELLSELGFSPAKKTR